MSSHDHHHGDVSSGRLGGAALTNVAFAVVQVLVGLGIGSVAVLADAAHQTVDAIGLVTAVGAAWLLRRPAGHRTTYGLGRADALGALLSGMLLVASVVWIAREAIERLTNPPDVAGVPVIIIGVIAVVVNGTSLWLVGHGGDHLSLRAARLHLLTDLGGSVVVVITGLVLAGTSVTWIDPAASLLLCVTVMASTAQLLRHAAAVLLDAAPASAVHDVRTILGRDPAVREVHHLHVRDLGAGRMSVTAHLIVERQLDVHGSQILVDRAATRLADELGITHTTLQVECHDCADAVHDGATATTG